jgi:hypothetical protein
MERPKRKAGYRLKLVVRNGKKKWINERIEGKRVHLSLKQRLALTKARLKAHRGRAELKRKRSNHKRKSFGL